MDSIIFDNSNSVGEIVYVRAKLVGYFLQEVSLLCDMGAYFLESFKSFFVSAALFSHLTCYAT